MHDVFAHDTSGGGAFANAVRGRSGSTVGPSGSHDIIGTLKKTNGPRKKEKTAMSHFWDAHHTRPPLPTIVWCVSQQWDIAVFSFFLDPLAFCNGPIMSCDPLGPTVLPERPLTVFAEAASPYWS